VVRAMRPLIPLALLAGAALVSAGGAARAGWTVSNPQYDYFNSDPSKVGTYGLAQCESQTSNGVAYVKMTLWGLADAWGLPQRFEVKHWAVSAHRMKLDLTRAPPFRGPPGPPPIYCPQQMNMTAMLCHDFDELLSVTGDFRAYTWELAGPSHWSGYPNAPHAPRPPYYDLWQGFFSETAGDRHPPPSAKSVSVQTPWIDAAIDWHAVDWVKVYVEGWIHAGSGRVVAEAKACKTGASVSYKQP